MTDEVNQSDLLSVAEACKYLHISRSTLVRLKNAGSGPKHVQLARRVLYRKADLDAFISQNVSE